MSDITPKNNLKLIGHEEAQNQWFSDLSSGKLAHGWLITGPEGIGKATLAYRFARTLLTGLPPEKITSDNPTILRIQAGSHSDFLAIEPLFDAKKDEFAKDITVDQARQIPEFLSMTPGEGQWRVIIIDSIDSLNNNGANAILKILEEPPAQTVLFLISHNPGRLLPTIRSRCRQLPLKALDYEQYRKVMTSIGDVESSDIQTLGVLSHYSPGIALKLHEGGAAALYNKIIDTMLNLPNLDSAKAYSLADSIGSGSVHSQWRLFTRLILSLFERIAQKAAKVPLEAVSDKEATLHSQMAAMHPAPVLAAKWQEVADQFLLAERLHLDYKQFIIMFLHSIPNKEEFKTAA